MDKLKKEDASRFAKQFSNWDKVLKAAKVANLEALYKKVHSEIRKAPKRVKADRAATVRKQITKENGSLVLQNSKGKKWLR
jgi:hypothetical protein